jgi:hypothetical protein
MSDIILQGNLESPLLSSLLRNTVTDLSYVVHKNYPNISRQKVLLNPNPAGALTQADLSNAIQTFTLPSWGILTDLIVVSQITCAGNNNPVIVGDSNRTTGSQGGRGLYSNISLLSNNRTICSTTDGLYRVRAETSSFAVGMRLKYMSKYFSTGDGTTLVSTWSSGAVVTYTPFYSSFFESIQCYLDLAFVQQLQLQLTYNSYTRMGLVYPITSATTTLAMFYYNLQTDALARLRSQNFNPSDSYIALGWNTYQETGQVTTNVNVATGTTIYPQVQYPVYVSHVYLKDRTYDVNVPISQITVTMGGKVIYSNFAPVPMTSDQDIFGGSGLLNPDQVLSANATGSLVAAGAVEPLVYLSTTHSRPISIYWGLEPNQRTFNSGAVSLHNIPNFSINVTSAVSSTNVDWYLVHEYYTMVSINSADGAVTVSYSS